MPRWSKLDPSRRYRAPRRAALLAATMLSLGGCFGSTPDCNDPEVARTIATLFGHQLKFTPYARFIDLDKARLEVESIFTIDAGKTSRSCVAFVTYDVKLNDAGQHVEGRKRLLYSLLYELAGEKQVYYKISRADDGHVQIHVDRVGG